jgi:hypothetical protein
LNVHVNSERVSRKEFLEELSSPPLMRQEVVDKLHLGDKGRGEFEASAAITKSKQPRKGDHV